MLLLKNCKVHNFDDGSIQIRDILIDGGRIMKVSGFIECECENMEVIDIFTFTLNESGYFH